MRLFARRHDQKTETFALLREDDTQYLVPPPTLKTTQSALRRFCRGIIGRVDGRRLRDAEEASAAKSRQMATVVHELRTPLNGILGMTYLLGQTKLSPEQQNYLSGIRQSGHALAQLVEDLLDHSTMEAGRFRLNTRAANLRQLIESVVEMLAPRAHEKGIEIAATMMADLPELLEFDPARLRQVLFNVVGNAVKFTQEGGVLVRAYVEHGEVAMTVTDTGPGMSEKERTRIFSEFEQVGEAAERSGGTGLGLSIASRILAEFSGSLSVSSKPGDGSTFAIRFPLLLAEDAAAGAGERDQLLRKSRVLLLAPQGPAATATVATIETLGGHCHHAGSLEEAELFLSRSAKEGLFFTDLIVDHRMAAASVCRTNGASPHRILLVNPEERASQPQDIYDAWLIRPLREKSLIDVLSGRLRGFARREDLPVQAQKDPLLSASGRTLDILVAEDDPVSAMLVGTALRKAGHRVAVVESTTELLDVASVAAGRPDVVITDLHMPGMALPDALAVLRADERRHRRPLLPVILLTGDSVLHSADMAALGVVQTLTKPVDPRYLLEVLEAVMQRIDAEQLR